MSFSDSIPFFIENITFNCYLTQNRFNNSSGKNNLPYYFLQQFPLIKTFHCENLAKPSSSAAPRRWAHQQDGFKKSVGFQSWSCEQVPHSEQWFTHKSLNYGFNCYHSIVFCFICSFTKAWGDLSSRGN